MNTIGKSIAVLLTVWALWVVWEWKNTIRDLTSTPKPSLAERSRQSRMASLLPPIQVPTQQTQPVGESGWPDAELPVVPPPPKSLALTANEAAEAFFREKKREWGVRDYHELRPSYFETPLGTRVKYAAYQDGLPIVGAEITLEVSSEKDVSVLENTYQGIKKADVSENVLSQDMVLQKNPGRYQLDTASTAGVSRVLFLAPGSDEPELSYVMPVRENGTGPSENLVFRASDGMVIGRQSPREF